ncbi:MAG: hypothetical protein ACOYXW_00510, partial [Actinomycetota bacterium]
MPEKVVLRLAPDAPPPPPEVRLLLGRPLHRDVLDASARGPSPLDGYDITVTDETVPLGTERARLCLLRPRAQGSAGRSPGPGDSPCARP